jgi:hypothetical protein
MKTKAESRHAKMLIVLAALAIAGVSRAQTTPARAPVADDARPLTFAEAQETIAATRRYVAHPPPAEKDERRPAEPMKADFRMAEPPPPARTETVPATPVAGYVWVPGHYMPFEGKWRWVRGEWAAPATPSSVWIAARYDPKEKKWTPGYWQPDRPAVPDPNAGKDSAAAAPY